MRWSKIVILGIESSCDETAMALLDGEKILNELVWTQDIHQSFGGVVPEWASRLHSEALPNLLIKLLENQVKKVQGIAVSQGPGLMGSLLAGVSFAQGLAAGWEVPLWGINHVHAHVHACLLDREPLSENEFPALAFVISGGHTHLYAMNHSTDFRLIMETKDDAIGECFDKVARLLGAAYPGGAQIEIWALQGKTGIELPKILPKDGLSYSGLKTHMSRICNPSLNFQDKADLCLAFQEEAFIQLLRGLKNVKGLSQFRSLWIGGGVSINARCRELLGNFAHDHGLRFRSPLPKYCGDNGAMIARSAMEFMNRGVPPSTHLRVYSHYES